MQVTEIAGVYDADGGIAGEASYVIGTLLGRAHCSLCDITHATVRRKPEWDAMVRRLGIPFRLMHRNEMPREIKEAVGDEPLAIVLARADGQWRPLLSAAELSGLDGSVARFEGALAAELDGRGWSVDAARAEDARTAGRSSRRS